MLRPSGQIARTYGIPRAVMREAYSRNPVHRAKMREALGKVRDLCVELGLVTPVSPSSLADARPLGSGDGRLPRPDLA